MRFLRRKGVLSDDLVVCCGIDRLTVAGPVAGNFHPGFRSCSEAVPPRRRSPPSPPKRPGSSPARRRHGYIDNPNGLRKKQENGSSADNSQSRPEQQRPAVVKRHGEFPYVGDRRLDPDAQRRASPSSVLGVFRRTRLVVVESGQRLRQIRKPPE